VEARGPPCAYRKRDGVYGRRVYGDARSPYWFGDSNTLSVISTRDARPPSTHGAARAKRLRLEQTFGTPSSARSGERWVPAHLLERFRRIDEISRDDPIM